MSPNIVQVAVAVLQKSDGSFLLAQRPVGKPYAGYWEFPGGKIESGESVVAALKRELQEELGVNITQAYPWITRTFTYPHAIVKLHFYRVVAWSGAPESRENQAFSWHTDATHVTPMLPANAPVLKALSLPAIYAISNVSMIGKNDFLKRLEHACKNGLRLLQLREKAMSEEALRDLYFEVAQLTQQYSLTILINSDNALKQFDAFDGVHLTSTALMKTTIRPDVAWCGASCHNAVELQHAAELGLDFVVLGQVGVTPSHTDRAPLGWTGFAALTIDYPLPVYALGGMTMSDRESAYLHGAHGIAMMRGWE